MVKPEVVLELVNEILSEDPIPFDRINTTKDDSINLIFTSVQEQYLETWSIIDNDKRDEMLLAVLTKTLAENFYLHTKLLMLEEEDRE